MRGDFQQQPCAFSLPGLSLHLKTRVMLLHRTLPSHKVLATGLGHSRHPNRCVLLFKRKSYIYIFQVPKKEGSKETLGKNRVSSLHRGLATFKDQKVLFLRYEARRATTATEHKSPVWWYTLNQNTSIGPQPFDLTQHLQFLPHKGSM